MGSVNAIFAEARRRAQSGKEGERTPVIIYMDEIERFSNRDDVVEPNQAATINALLMQMDGVESNEGVTVFGLTNRVDKMDIALRRPGRFGKEVEFLPPDMEGRLKILYIHMKELDHKFTASDDDIVLLAGRTHGYTGGDLRGVLDEAFTNAHLDNRIKLTLDDLTYGLGKTNPSAIRDMPFKEPTRKLGNMGGYALHKELLRRIMTHSHEAMMVFYGPEGTGKTDFAEAMAGEYGYNLIVIAGSAPEDKFVGETGRKIDMYIDRAKALAPCVLVFDEIDALLERRGTQSWKGSWTGLLQSRLSQPIEGVYVVATLNHIESLSNVFLSRFPHRLYFNVPKPDEQIEIWESYGVEGASEIVEGEDGGMIPEVTGRSIHHAVMLVNQYGLKPDVKTYRRLIERTHKPVEGLAEYAKVREEYGDSVMDFEAVKDLMLEVR